MKQDWSKSWKASTQPRKQRKYRANAPDHVKRSFLGCHLSKELREKHGTRTVKVRKGDKVKVLRGQFKGQSGKVERVNVSHEAVFVTKIETIKKDGTKNMQPLKASSLMIIELDSSDKRRLKTIKKGETKIGKAAPQEA
ncbi:MAG: 50S ribosomal protein L24 [archaeon]